MANPLTMRFDPIRCPTCGGLARGTVEQLSGCALFMYVDARGEPVNPPDPLDDDHAEELARTLGIQWEGETDVWWDGQRTRRDPEGRARLICQNGDEWWATEQGAKAEAAAARHQVDAEEWIAARIFDRLHGEDAVTEEACGDLGRAILAHLREQQEGT